ncbi:MAG: Gfo/Idh/MocA family oxidoreductase [Thermodesulfobacteriota bacterium]
MMAAGDGEDEELHVGIIGTGRHGSRYARHIVAGDIPGLRLGAISRRSPVGQEQAAAFGAQWHADWRELVASSRVGGVIAATTPNLHAAIARCCARHDKPLLLEKPLAATPADAAEIAAIAAQGRIPITVGHTLRFNSTVLALGALLERVGRLHCFHASQRLEPSFHAWLDVPELAGGGVLLHTAVHIFDALRFITGRDIRRVRAVGFRRHNRCLEDLVLVQLEMEGGLVGSIDASKVGAGRCGRYEFVGEDGLLQGDQVHGTLEFIVGAGRESIAVGAPVPALVPLLTGWLAYLRGRAENPVTVEDGRRAVLVADACRRAMESDGWISLF